MYDKISSNCQKLHINQAIATDYLVTTPDALISDILKIWQPSNLGCVLVQQHDFLLGIFTSSDIVRTLARSSLEHTTVSEVMTPNVVTQRLSECGDPSALLKVLQQHHIRFLPILGDRDHVIGIVSLESLITLLQTEFDDKVAASQLEQQQTEALLHHYERIVSATPDCISLVDRNYIYQVVNESYLTWNQKSADEIVGHSIADLVGQELFETLVKHYHDLCLAGEPQTIFHTSKVYADGKQRYIKATYSPYVELDGTISGVVANIHDLTDAKLAEDALRESEERFRQMATNIHEVFWLTDIDLSRLIYISPAYEQIWGRSCASLYENPMSFLEAIHPDDRATVFNTIQQHCLTGFSHEYRLLHDDGTISWIWERGFSVHDDSGTPYRLVGISQDITDRKQAEEQLKKSEAFLAETQAIAHIGSWQLDIQTQKVTWSKELFRMFGLDPEQPEPSYTDFLQLIYADDRIILQELVEQASIHGTPYSIICRALLPDQSIRYHEGIGEVEINDQGQVIRLLGTALDITDRKKLENALQDSETKLNDILNSAIAAISRHMVKADGSWENDYISNGCELISGFTVAELNADKFLWSRRINPEDLQAIEAQAYADIFAERRGTYIYQLRHKDESWRWISQTNCSRWDASHNAWSVTIISSDISDLKQAEAALRSSESRSRAILAAIPDLIILANADGVYLDYVIGNRQFSIIPEEVEIIGRSMADFIPAEVWQRHSHYIQRALHTGELQIYEQTVRLRDRPHHEEVRIIKSGENEVLFIIRNISDRKQAEELLRHSEAALIEAQSVAHIGSWQFDLQTQKITWSKELFRMFGLDPEQPEPTFTDYLQLIYADDRIILKESVERAVTHEIPYHIDYRIVLPDQSIRYHEGIGEVEINDQGQVMRLFGTALDITDRKHLENTIREGEAYLQSLIQNAPVILYGLNSTGAITVLEGHGLESLNIKPSELIGQSVFDLLSAYPQVLEGIRSALTGNIATPWVTHLGNFVFENRFTMLHDQNGEISGLIGVATDCTERDRAEEALHRQLLQTQVLSLIVQQIHDSLDLDTTFNAVVSTVGKFLEIDRLAITQYMAEPQIWRPVAEYRINSTIPSILGVSIQSNNPMSEQLLKGEGIFIDSKSSDKDKVNYQYAHTFVGSWFMIPLIVNNITWGAITANYHDRQHLWEADEIDIINAISKQIAIAIQQATLYQQVQQDAQKERLLRMLAERIRQSLELDEILVSATFEVRQFLQTDRVVVFRVDPAINGMGKVIAESVIEPWQKLLGQKLEDGCFRQNGYDLMYQEGCVRAITDIDSGEITPCHADFLRQLDVRSNLVVPIRQADNLWGLLIAHQCDRPRKWTRGEIDFLQQLAEQVGIAIQQSSLYEQLLQELSHRKRVANALERLNQQLEQKVEERTAELQSIFQLAAVGIAQTDAQTNYFLKVNQKFCEIIGYTHAELLSKTFRDITHPDDLQLTDTFVYRLQMQKIQEYTLEKRYIRKDNKVIWVLNTVSLLRNPDGTAKYRIAIIQDITDRKYAEETIQRSLVEKETLLKEIHHRVKNNMQLVTSLMRLQASQIEDPTLLAAFTDSQNRIHTMALIHEHLYQSQNLAQVDFYAYLKALVESLFHSYTTSDSGLTYQVTVEAILNLDAAIPCGLIVCELVSNALKYAFLGRQHGTIWVELGNQGKNYSLVVKDDGIGLPENFDPESTASLGLRLVTGLVEQLDGKLAVIKETGTIFSIKFPIENT